MQWFGLDDNLIPVMIDPDMQELWNAILLQFRRARARSDADDDIFPALTGQRAWTSMTGCQVLCNV